MKNTNALAETQWQKHQPETPVADLGLVSHQINEAVTNRAANFFNLLLIASVRAGHGGRGLWRLFFAHPSLVLRMGPNGETSELFEEYKTLHQPQYSPFLQR